MKLSKILPIVILGLLTSSCRGSKCPYQSEDTEINEINREVVTLIATSRLLGGDWCYIEKGESQVWEKTSYTRYSIGNRYSAGMAIVIFSTTDQAKEYLQKECSGTVRFHNLLACNKSDQTEYDSSSKHYNIGSSIAWTYRNHYFVADNNSFGTYYQNVPIPSAEAELLYLLAILTGLIPIFTNEYIQIIIFLIGIGISFLIIRRITVIHKK
jgi:hypothetical protein